MTVIIDLPGAMKCPDGFWTKHVELEELTGAEENILLDVTRDPKNKEEVKVPFRERALQVLSRCTSKIGGVSRPSGSTSKTDPLFFYAAWKAAFLSDRHYAWIRLRQESVLDGDSFAFHTQCPKCGHEPSGRHTVNLNDLEVTRLPIETFENPDAFLYTLPKSGKVVEWSHPTGVEEEHIEKLFTKSANHLRTGMLVLRTRTIDGKKATESALADIGKKDLQSLSVEMSSKDFGIDISVETVCEKEECGHVYKKNLPVSSNDFFFPLEDLSSSRMTSSSSSLVIRP